MQHERYDVFVVGGGAAGSEVAFSLAKRGGFRVGLAERDKLGGECNHHGCVPTKAMLASARLVARARRADALGVRIPDVTVDFPAVKDRVRRLIEASSGEGARPFERLGIDVVPDEVRLVGPHTLEVADGQRIEADRIVLAIGTEAVIPPVDGLADGPYWTNKEAIWAPTRPPASLAIMGAGAIGIEFAQLYARFGTKVTVIEEAPRILPSDDPANSAALLPCLEEDGITFLTDRPVAGAQHDNDRGWRLRLDGGRVVHAAALLVATGRAPDFGGHDLDAAGIELDDGKPVLNDTLRTTADGVWVVGDATGDLLFTHVADYEAAVAVADIAGEPFRRDYRVVPRVTYCDPEVASVGLTEDEASEDHDVVTATVALADGDRAMLDGREAGLVKLVADARTGELLGGHIVAERAGDLIHQVVAVMAGKIPSRTVARAIHAYPTLSEQVRAAFAELADKLGD